MIFMHKSPCPLPYKSNYRIRLSKFKRLHQCPHICPKKYKDVIINHTYKRSFFNHEGKNKTGYPRFEWSIRLIPEPEIKNPVNPVDPARPVKCKAYLTGVKQKYNSTSFISHLLFFQLLCLFNALRYAL